MKENKSRVQRPRCVTLSIKQASLHIIETHERLVYWESVHLAGSDGCQNGGISSRRGEQ